MIGRCKGLCRDIRQTADRQTRNTTHSTHFLSHLQVPCFQSQTMIHFPHHCHVEHPFQPRHGLMRRREQRCYLACSALQRIVTLQWIYIYNMALNIIVIVILFYI